jgi:hypothetical protein
MPFEHVDGLVHGQTSPARNRTHEVIALIGDDNDAGRHRRDEVVEDRPYGTGKIGDRGIARTIATAALRSAR